MDEKIGVYYLHRASAFACIYIFGNMVGSDSRLLIKDKSFPDREALVFACKRSSIAALCYIYECEQLFTVFLLGLSCFFVLETVSSSFYVEGKRVMDNQPITIVILLVLVGLWGLEVIFSMISRRKKR